MHEIHWNKNHTKARIWTTISDGWLTPWSTVDELRDNPKFHDLILMQVDKICPCCNRKYPPTPSGKKGKV